MVPSISEGVRRKGGRLVAVDPGGERAHRRVAAPFDVRQDVLDGGADLGVVLGPVGGGAP